MKTSHETIALMRPQLPMADSILSYMREIDTNRQYSNFGPLSMRLAERFAGFFALGAGSAVSLPNSTGMSASTQNSTSVVVLSNGTAGLTNIIRALNLPRGTYCLLPSWTFIATPASVLSAGLIPYFLDVDENSWALNPAVVREHIKKAGSDVSAVMVVAPFGAPLDTKMWDALSEETGVPVIIDAAAAFDSCINVPFFRPGKSPVMISLHATKAMGIGEGGVVISQNSRLVSRVQEMSNFGFSGSRSIHTPGTNGKMSEYQAAVGLAALDEWPEKRAGWQQLKAHFTRAFAAADLPVDMQPCANSDWVSSTMNIRLRKGEAAPVIDQLNEAGIESRQWWKGGCHLQPAYAMYPKAPLPVTEKLGHSVLALPFTLDMNQSHVAQIVTTLGTILRGRNDIHLSMLPVSERAVGFNE